MNKLNNWILGHFAALFLVPGIIGIVLAVFGLLRDINNIPKFDLFKMVMILISLFNLCIWILFTLKIGFGKIVEDELSILNRQTAVLLSITFVIAADMVVVCLGFFIKVQVNPGLVLFDFYQFSLGLGYAVFGVVSLVQQIRENTYLSENDGDSKDVQN